jgi:hypothetical protein
LWIGHFHSKTDYPPDLAPRRILPYIGIRAGLDRLSVAGVEEEGEWVGFEPYLKLLAATVDRRSMGCGSTGCAGRTRPPLVGVWSGPRSRRRSSCGSAPVMSLNGDDAHHLVGASRREETPLRPLDGGASTQ